MRKPTLLLLPLMLLAGCGGGINKNDLVGNWKGSVGMTYAAMQKDAGGDNEQSRFLAAQEMEEKFIKLELKADGTAVFENERILQCTWSLDGDTLILNLPKNDSTEEAKTFSGTYRFSFEDKDTMKADDPNVADYFIRFRKA